MKRIFTICLLLVGLVGCGPSDEEKKRLHDRKVQESIERAQKEEQAANPTPAPPVEKTGKEMFYEAYEDCKRFDKSPFVINQISDIRNHESIVSMWALDIKSGKALNDKNLKKDIHDFENLLIKVQKKAYPMWRKQWLAFKREELFRFNVDVRKGGGDSYNIVQFINVDFADNAVIEDFNNQIWEDIKKFRFKKVIYAWSEYDGRNRSYTPKTPPDNKIEY